jgi:hypothetical protein
MANVTEVINRNATGIHSNPFAMKGNEILFLAGQRVVDTKSHRFALDYIFQISDCTCLPAGRD